MLAGAITIADSVNSDAHFPNYNRSVIRLRTPFMFPGKPDIVQQYTYEHHNNAYRGHRGSNLK
jgi:hypothetical protein